MTAHLVRAAGTFVRASIELGARSVELDLVHESTPDLDTPLSTDGVLTGSLIDLRVDVTQ